MGTLGKLRGLFDSPFLRRISWRVKRVGEKIDRRFFTSLLAGRPVVLMVSRRSRLAGPRPSAQWATWVSSALGELDCLLGCLSRR